MKDITLIVGGAYFASQAMLSIPWVVAIWYTDKWLSRL